MKSFLAASFLVMAGPAFAAEPWELTFPSLEEQIAQAEQDRFDAFKKEVETSPEWAGMTTTLRFRGEEFIIDRKTEPRPRPGVPPSRSDILQGLLGNLSTSSRATLHIEVHREYNQDGSIKSEDWTIDVGGSWQATTGMDDAMSKSHK